MDFQGGKIRFKLVTELSGAEGVIIEEGTAGDTGKAAAQNGMRKYIELLSMQRALSLVPTGYIIYELVIIE